VQSLALKKKESSKLKETYRNITTKVYIHSLDPALEKRK
jgi:hypothetical protein